MFEKLFRKNRSPNAAAPSANQEAPVPAGNQAPQQKLKVPTSPSAEELLNWQARILAAAGDDTSLLQLAHQAPAIDLKMTALQALTQESSYKQAMHDFRDHDKRLYRAAKSGWEAASGRRIANEAATALIVRARTLLLQETIPVNLVVELDRAWAGMDSKLLDAALVTEYSLLSKQLADRIRLHGEKNQLLTRWLSAMDAALNPFADLIRSVARGENSTADLSNDQITIRTLIDNAPESTDPRSVAMLDTARQKLALADCVIRRVEFLNSLPAAGTAHAENEALLLTQWHDLADHTAGHSQDPLRFLEQRFTSWRNANSSALKLEQAAHEKELHARQAETNAQRKLSIQRDVEAAEVALADGHIADLTRLLAALDKALQNSSVDTKTAQRIDFLRREQQRLKGWQSWGGGQSREQLSEAAQEFARLSTGKIDIREQSDAISKLRARWKELDKLSAASSQSLWHTFDNALKEAYTPVALHVEKRNLARQENLAARELIVTELMQARTRLLPDQLDDETSSPPPDWRAISHALDQARNGWHKLGPVEHTLPRHATQGDEAVTTRYAAAFQALESPLKIAHEEGIQKREKLIAATTRLSDSDLLARDLVDRVRELQMQWQAIAKSLPLFRHDENRLWSSFKAATDSIFKARDEARAASEAVITGQINARESIITQLIAASSMSMAAEIRRAISDAELAWRACPDIARSHQAKQLDARFRDGIKAAKKRLDELAQLASQTKLDALLAAITLCHERETLQSAASINADQIAEMESRWHQITALPSSWKKAMDARFSMDNNASDDPAGQHTGTLILDSLLELEAACGIESPQEFHAARQQFNIRALKNAMEGRQASMSTPENIERLLIETSRHPRPDKQSIARLEKIISHLRNGLRSRQSGDS